MQYISPCLIFVSKCELLQLVYETQYMYQLVCSMKTRERILNVPSFRQAPILTHGDKIGDPVTIPFIIGGTVLKGYDDLHILRPIFHYKMTFHKHLLCSESSFSKAC